MAGIVKATQDGSSLGDFNHVFPCRVLAKAPEMIQGDLQNPAEDHQIHKAMTDDDHRIL
jgi:hypothetical protein